MSTDFRALCVELMMMLENAINIVYCEDGTKHISTAKPIVNRARAALADEPAVPEGREPASVTGQPNWRGLCEELVDAWLKGDDIVSAMNRARAVLARWGTSNLTQTRLSPADGEVAELVAWLRSTGEGQPCLSDENYARLTRAADLLERLSPPQPVPVSERLPEPSDCAPWPKDSDASAWCWMGQKVDGGWEWEQRSAGYLVAFPGDFTHWLPAHALPLPEVGE